MRRRIADGEIAALVSGCFNVDTEGLEPVVRERKEGLALLWAVLPASIDEVARMTTPDATMLILPRWESPWTCDKTRAPQKLINGLRLA